MNALRRAFATPAVIALLLSSSQAAVAQEVSTPEFSTLVENAQEDPGATSQLREIRSIDGFETDMAQIIDGSTSNQQHQISSLDRLVDETTDAARSADELRTEARDIVSEPPFNAEQAVGTGLLEQVVNFLARVLSGDGMTGIALFIVAAVALAIAVPVLLRMARVREQSGSAPEVATAAASNPNYAEAAGQAEANGDFDRAIRLLFLDGVDYLEQVDVVRSAATTSTATVRRLSKETEFLDTFDAVAYGGLSAKAGDVAEAKTAWGRLKARRFNR